MSDSMHWADKKETVKIFYTSCLICLQRNRKISELITDPFHDLVIVAVDDWASEKDKTADEMMKSFVGQGAATQAFQDWSVNWKGAAPKFSRITLDRLEVSFNVPMGKGASVTFTAQAIIPYDPSNYSHAEIEQDYDELWAVVASGYISFARKPPSLAVAAGIIPEPVSNKSYDPANVLEQAITGIVCEEKPDKKTGKGKRYYKLQTAHFSEFGVRVWDEVLQAARVPVGKLSVGVTPFKEGWKAGILAVDPQKPEKVVYIINPKGQKFE